MPELTVYLNGAFVPYDQASIGVEDRSVQFGDGIYEVIRWYGGKPFRLESHLRRLDRSAAGIELTIPPTEQLYKAMEELIRRNGFSDAALYLQSTRGTTARVQGIPAGGAPSVIMIARPTRSERPAPPIKA